MNYIVDYPNKTRFPGLTKIISGGQTGADQAGLLAAQAAGILTGGTAPRGFQTSTGPNHLLSAFGLKDHGTLQTRTKTNIRDSDATAILTMDHSSAGSALTRRLCAELNRPYIDLDISAACATYGDTGGVPADMVYELSMALSQFVILKQVRTLNVAGNREKTPTFAVLNVSRAVVAHALQILDLEGFLIRDSDL